MDPWDPWNLVLAEAAPAAVFQSHTELPALHQFTADLP